MMGIRSARTAGKIPPDYKGPLFYRMSNFAKPNPPSKVLYDYLTFPGRSVLEVNEISYLSMRDAIVGPDYLDEHGNVKSEWTKPIRAVVKTSFRSDWPEFSIHRMMLISARLKALLEQHVDDNHAFVPMDLEEPDGEPVVRVFVMVRGVAIDAVDYISSKINPTRIYPGGKASWLPLTALPRDEFCFLSKSKVNGRHHFWDENLGHVWSKEIVDQMGDVLPKEFVFVAMGVTE